MTVVADRFWAKVDKGSDDECWEWRGAISGNGYGNFFESAGKWVPAHRFSYIVARGDIAEGLVIDHLCRNTRCVNPSHLEAVTQRVNLLRGETVQAANIIKTHCPVGHEYTPENTLSWTRSTGSVHRKCRECDRTRVRNKYRREHEVPECRWLR